MAVKVRVQQKDGEVVVSAGGDEPRRYSVSDHIISARTREEADEIVATVPDAKLETGK